MLGKGRAKLMLRTLALAHLSRPNQSFWAAPRAGNHPQLKGSQSTAPVASILFGQREVLQAFPIRVIPEGNCPAECDSWNAGLKAMPGASLTLPGPRLLAHYCPKKLFQV